MHKTLTWPTATRPNDTPRRWRRAAASLLSGASRHLDHWAQRLEPPVDPVLYDPMLEFYACAGDSDGSLYLDGRRVGTLPGVTRL